MEHDYAGQSTLVHFVTQAGLPAGAPTHGASAASGGAPRIRIRGLRKAYGPILANDGIDLEIARGGIHAIVGENGAGKTTLVRAVYGLVEPDAGSIELDGQRITIASPAQAIQHGIGMVHQRFQLVEPLTALGPGGGPSERRGSPAARNHAAALPQGRRLDLRRADQRAHAAGSRRPLPRAAASRRPGSHHHLHHAQAPRGLRPRGARDRHAPRTHHHHRTDQRE
ncbi:MAG: ATP-binding cassette domain-containing protein [Chloroflexi bacterium]|nr:MAG: ATP-binding cassette domain-containing protein [Chloroflexota bacterium]